MSQATRDARPTNENILHGATTKGPAIPPIVPAGPEVPVIAVATKPLPIHTADAASALIPSVAILEQKLEANARERKRLQALLRLAKDEEGGNDQ